MKRKTPRVAAVVPLTKLPVLVAKLLKDEAIGGKLILAFALLALLVANSPLNPIYQEFWHYELTLGLGDYSISMDLAHWVSEGLMAIFFLVVGSEIKREIVRGELRDPRRALLPIGAAIGGMIVPAAIFLGLNQGNPDTIRGWAIPVATDIAFAVGVLSLLGNRVSSSLKLFLLTLAIVDDIGAITLIALLYSTGLAPVFLLAAVGLAAGILILNKLRLMTLPLFICFAVVFWIVTYKSGVHASIAGAVMGLLAPLTLHRGKSVAERLEGLSIPVSTFFVVPLFAFASLGITLSAGSFSNAPLPLASGIIAGLVIGKVIGVAFTSWILVRLRVAELPSRSNWYQMVGVGFLAGIGFTVSVFISDLAFADNSTYLNTAKISVLIASTASAVAGYLFLRNRKAVETLLTK